MTVMARWKRERQETFWVPTSELPRTPGYPNILKRVVLDVAGDNLRLVIRSLFGVGSSRRLKGLCSRVFSWIRAFWMAARRPLTPRRLNLVMCASKR